MSTAATVGPQATRAKANGGGGDHEQLHLQLESQLAACRAKLKSFDAEKGCLREQVEKYKAERLALHDAEWRAYKRGEEVGRAKRRGGIFVGGKKCSKSNCIRIGPAFFF